MLVKRTLLIAGGVALAFAWSGGSANAQGVFTITSPSFKDGERLATKNAGNNKQNPNCVGENVSPALSWANPPAGTKSYALLMFDPEGRPPGGVSHWVAYGIPVSVTGFAEGEVSQQTEKYVGGKSLMGLPHYFGPCTPPGAPHHYTFTLIATDLEPNALQPGHDARRAHQGVGRARQGRDRHHRNVLEAVSSSVRHGRSCSGHDLGFRKETWMAVRGTVMTARIRVSPCRDSSSSRSSFSSRSRWCCSGSSSPPCPLAA